MPAGTFNYDEFAEKLAQVQAEQVPWVEHNFGKRPSSQPLIGMVEEIGELAEAVGHGATPHVLDSLADLVIFGIDYASARGWDAAEIALRSLQVTAFRRPADAARLVAFQIEVGRLSHAHLKHEQQIRTDKDHVEDARVALAHLWLIAREFAESRDVNLGELVLVTWNRVRARDWKRNPRTA